MSENRKFDSDRAAEFKNKFPVVARIIKSSIPKPFRPSGVINSAVLEAVMVTLLENPLIEPSDLEGRYRALLADKRFLELIRGATTDTATLRERLHRARELLTNGTI
ncbi:hypothetical protein [Leptolyngbya sp. 7M]|uniref:hypothetical protein n=1 Tax=Leptolyngbya sp. 7M TaxID=2812896 RepID=UPI001B8C62EE|nr:hypothetical protein [Leptolyngbya sp. 7M]QYO64985.1 hypothetical protein JVX88_36595 [Leptolyngbya sp. 7M]